MQGQNNKNWYRSRYQKSVRKEYLYSQSEINHLKNVENIFQKYQNKNQIDINKLKNILVQKDITFSEQELLRLFPHQGKYFQKVDFKQFQNALQENCVFGRALLNLNFLTERHKKIKEIQKQEQTLTIEKKTEIMKELLDYEINFIQEYTKNYQKFQQQQNQKKNQDEDYLVNAISFRVNLDQNQPLKIDEDNFINNKIRQSNQFTHTYSLPKRNFNQYLQRGPSLMSSSSNRGFQYKKISAENFTQNIIKN